MKLVCVKLKNFRSYVDETSIRVDDMTILIGRNDAGKSTVLEALDIFFNDSLIEHEDASVGGDPRDVRITCIFSELPTSIVLDEQHPTTLQDEYLLRSDGKLEITRIFNCSSTKGKQTRIFATSQHPTKTDFSDLHTLNITDLKKRAKDLDIDLTGVTQTIKTQIRRAIWNNDPDELAVSESEVDLSAQSGKAAWDQIQQHLPIYALFKSDRASRDQDEEAQDPMKAAIKEAVKSHEAQLSDLVDQVKVELNRVVQKTVEKIQEMSPGLADTLNPQVKNKNWESLFSVSLTGDEGISINKRGSGTRRLVLLNFFRAKAEDAASAKNTGVIYAIEEPETSQHPIHQLMLLDAFQDLCDSGTAQILITTHTPTLARKARRDCLRFISNENGFPEIQYGDDDTTLQSIKDTLGILPDHDIKVFVGVEGKWDIEFLKRISTLLNSDNPDIPNLEIEENNGGLVFIPLGGSSMELWTHRLAGLERPELYITDRDTQPPDQPKYQTYLDDWNSRPNCSGACTKKRELENYLHPNAIKSIAPNFPDVVADFDDVPLMLAEILHRENPDSKPWDEVKDERRKKKISNAKRRLNREGVSAMTVQMLNESDPYNEIETWLRTIGKHLSS